jgi:hypothetical protein
MRCSLGAGPARVFPAGPAAPRIIDRKSWHNKPLAAASPRLSAAAPGLERVQSTGAKTIHRTNKYALPTSASLQVSWAKHV